MFCRRYVVRGLVQGVFFRASTQQTARQLGLGGWVRNLPDGNVELVACGAKEKLTELESWLHKGPPRAKVEEVVVADAEPRKYPEFEIVS